MSAAAFGGAALGLVGNWMQGQQQNKSEERALAAQRNMRLGNIPLLLAMGLGSNASTAGRALLGREEGDYIFGTNPELTASQQARMSEIQARLGQLGQARGAGWLGNKREGATAKAQEAATQRERDALNFELDQLAASVKNAQPGIVNSKELDAAAQYLPGAQYAKLADQNQQAGLGMLGRYDTETNNMMRMLKGLGDSERERVTRESERDLTRANRLASQRLGRMGAGASTILGSTLANNAGQIGERRNNTINSINTGVTQQKLGLMGQRSGGRLGMESGLMSQDLNLRTAPLNQQMAILSNIGQSGLGGNSFQPVGGVSPLGAGLQTGGNFLAAWGGANAFGGQQQNAAPLGSDQYGNPLYGPYQQ
jgi:hypothetical protein